MTPIFRWSGDYVGFLADGWFFEAGGRYLGWYDANGVVWRADGRWLGQLVDAHYILRDRRATPPVRQTPRVPPIPPPPPRHPGDRIPKTPRPGWVDALEQIGRMPRPDDLIGEWRLGESVLTLGADGRFLGRSPAGPEEAGTWQYRGNLILTADRSGGTEARNIVYRIIEYRGDQLTLRRIVQEGHSLPFTLQRTEASPRPMTGI